MKIVMTNSERWQFEDDLSDAQPVHEYWIEIDGNQMTIEFHSVEKENKIYRFEIEELIE